MRSFAVLVTAAVAATVVATPAWAVNAAPVLDASKSPVMAAVLEDSAEPVGVVGTPVSDLVDLDAPSGGLDNVTDPDGGGPGIALIAADPSLSCSYTYNGGGSWGPIPTVSAAEALLLPAVLGRITCRGGPDFEGDVAAAVTFRAWDQTSGSAGGQADTTTNGGSTAFSTATDTASLTVTGTNDAPALDDSATPTLPTILEDAPAPSGPVGLLVSDIVDLDSAVGGLDNVSDIDVGAVTGVALVGSDGFFVCYYSLNDGDSWLQIGGLGGDTARLLAADGDNRIFCRGIPDLYGEATEPLWFRAWDRSVGTDGGTGDASINGGTTAYSSSFDYLVLTVDPVNDAPQATNLSAAETYNADTARNLTNIVVSDVDSETVTATLTMSDPSAGTLSTGSSGTTTSTYDGGTGQWSAAGPISEVNTLLASVTYTPAGGYTGSFTIATEVSDGDLSTSGSKPVSLAAVVPVVSIADAAVTEGNSGTKAMTFTLSLSEATTVPVSVRFTTSDRTARAGSDYTARAVTVSIPAGQTAKSVAVPVVGDTRVELDERFAVALTQPNGVTVGDGAAVGTSRNDDRGLRVLRPNGGESWAAGTTHRITWLYGRLSGTVTVQLVKAGEIVQTITRKAVIGSDGSGHIRWKVPAGMKAGKGYKIRLVSNKRPKFSDTSDHGFRITAG